MWALSILCFENDVICEGGLAVIFQIAKYYYTIVDVIPFQPRREGHGHVPGPITREKMYAYEIKQQSKTDKKEIISSSLINSLPEEDVRNKLVSPPSAPMSNLDGWSENIDMGVSSGSLAKEDSPQPMSLGKFETSVSTYSIIIAYLPTHQH